MPAISRRFLVTAALCLLAGIVLGLVMTVQRDLLGRWPAPMLISARTHLILVGGVLEAILGTAYWLFPRPARGAWRAPDWLGQVSWASLTFGTLLRAGAEVVGAADDSGIVRGLIVAGAVLQVDGLGVGLLVLHTRIRTSRGGQFGSKVLPQKPAQAEQERHSGADEERRHGQ